MPRRRRDFLPWDGRPLDRRLMPSALVAPARGSLALAPEEDGPIPHPEPSPGPNPGTGTPITPPPLPPSGPAGPGTS